MSDETTRLRALLERTATRVLTVAEERDAATKRAERAERERDDLAATLETRTAEHALAMARVRELEAIIAGRTTAALVSPQRPRIGWVRCERCQRVFTAVGDHHDDLDDLKAAAAESAETEFDDDGREVCGDCDAEVSRG